MTVCESEEIIKLDINLCQEKMPSIPPRKIITIYEYPKQKFDINH